MKKRFCVVLCVLMALFSVCACAEKYESVTVANPYYAFTAPDGTRTVTDLAGLSLTAEAALRHAEGEDIVSGRLLLSAQGEDALEAEIVMTPSDTFARVNSMNGKLDLGKNMLFDLFAQTLQTEEFDIIAALEKSDFVVTDMGEVTMTLEDGERAGHAYALSEKTADADAAPLWNLTVLDGGAFCAETAADSENGLSLLWNVAENGCGYAVFQNEAGSIRYDAQPDAQYPEKLRGTIAVYDPEGKMSSSDYLCFGPEKTENGLRTVLSASCFAGDAYAEFGEANFFASLVPADGSVWTVRGENGLVTIAAEKDGNRDFIRAEVSFAHSDDASLLPVPDFSGLPTVTADDEQIADAGLGLKVKLERIDAVRQLLTQWGVIEENN